MGKQTEVAKKAGASRDSTHGTAAQASAALAIRLLRSSYLGIETGLLTTPDSDEHKKAAVEAAQASLGGYIEAAITKLNSADANKPDIDESERNNPNIAASIKVVDYVFERPSYSKDDKIRILRQMRSFAQTFPGGVWDSSQAQWSTNKVYDTKTGEEVSEIASIAETLNLVAHALQDSERFQLLEGSTDEEDNGFRLNSLCLGLLELQKQVDEGQLQKCSAGRQHDLLFLLNHAFLDKPRTEDDAVPISMIEDTQAFLLDALSSFATRELKELPDGEQSALISKWAQFDAGLIDDHPFISFLREKYPVKAEGADPDAVWKMECASFLSEASGKAGLNPRGLGLEDTIAATEYLSLPIGPWSTASLAVEILAEKVFPVKHVTDEKMRLLIERRNQALGKFQKLLREKPWSDIHPVAIKNFFTAEQSFQTLNRYGYLAVFVGEDEKAFAEARQAYQEALSDYYTDHTPDKPLGGEFDEKKAAFVYQEQEFREKSHSDFVENFFVIVNSETVNFNAVWDRLQALRGGGTQHSLILSDEVLAEWYRSNTSSDDGTPVLNISSYEINRILLHAMLIQPKDWTDNFRHAILLVTRWLYQPALPEDSVSLKALKQTYDGPFLRNLMLVAYLQVPADNPIKIDMYSAVLRSEFFTQITGPEYHLYHTDYYKHVFGDVIRDQQKLQLLLNIVKDSGGVLINLAEISNLLSFPSNVLTVDMRTELWGAVKEQLSGLAERSLYGIVPLLSLSTDQLTADMRTETWDAVKGQLSGLAETSPYEIVQLFSLSIDQLTADMRTEAWDVVKGQLSGLVERCPDEIVRLFSLSTDQVTAGMRTELWDAFKGKLSWLVEESLHATVRLFSLSTDQLTTDMRTELLGVFSDVEKVDIAELARMGEVELVERVLIPQNGSQLPAAKKVSSAFRAAYDSKQWSVIEWFIDNAIQKNIIFEKEDMTWALRAAAVYNQLALVQKIYLLDEKNCPLAKEEIDNIVGSYPDFKLRLQSYLEEKEGIVKVSVHRNTMFGGVVPQQVSDKETSAVDGEKTEFKTGKV